MKRKGLNYEGIGKREIHELDKFIKSIQYQWWGESTHGINKMLC